VVNSETIQKIFALSRQLHQYLAAIIGGAQAADETAFDQPIDQFNSAVVLELHALGQDSNRRLELGG